MNVEDDDVRKYIHVKLRNKIITYGEKGEQFKDEQIYRVKPCTIDNFKTDYEIKFFERNKKDVLHCVENPRVFL